MANVKIKRQQDATKETLKNIWLGLGDTSHIEVPNTFVPKTDEERENPALHYLNIISNPDNFAFTCRSLLNIQLLPMQVVMLKEIWRKPFPMLIASRGASKTFLLGLYCILRCLLLQGRKVVITAASFRQAKHVLAYAANIWQNAPILRDICAPYDNPNDKQGIRKDTDRWSLKIGESTAVSLPLGDGQRIRGERANDILAEEFSATPPEIFETVVSGFGLVSASPVERVKQFAREQYLKEKNVISIQDKDKPIFPNQIVISGTADYTFKHFHRYWKRYKDIIETKGNKDKLYELLGDEAEDCNWEDFSIIRIPYDMLPKGFMDEKQIARSKATHHSSIFISELGACFSGDSNGFFKRSLVETCVTKPPIELSGEKISFTAQLTGLPTKKYVYGIDPASEIDNFSIVILEVNPTHRRIIYCWTIRKSLHKERVKEGLAKEQDFNRFCARKIRNLMKIFPCAHIAMDSQGGGYSVYEALNDDSNMEVGELKIWPVIEFDNKQDTDKYAGLHILELVSFSDSEYTVNANTMMKKDFEDKVLLFPYVDTVELALSEIQDEVNKRKYDTLETCIAEIEELKDELATIVHTSVGVTMRDRWDVPEIKLAGGKKGRQRKDRYTALLMANAAARLINQPVPVIKRSEVYGGLIQNMNEVSKGGQMYSGNQKLVGKLPNSRNYGCVVHH